MDYLNVLKALPGHEAAIYLISAFGTLFFALMLFSLLQRVTSESEKRWGAPFAATFWALTAIYFLLLIQVGIYRTTGESWEAHGYGYLALQFIVLCLSALTNYLFLLSGSRLWEPALFIDKERLFRVRGWTISSAHVRRALVMSLCLSVLLGAANLVGWARKWTTYPDFLLSFIALVYMGIALYKNSRSRREKLLVWEKAIAWLALLSSIGYAVLYVLWGLEVLNGIIKWYIGGTNDEAGLIASLLVSLISLPFKFWIFYSGYSLMLLIAGPLQGIVKLLENVTERDKEFLESDGILKSVWEEVHTERVKLYIKLPGAREDMIESYEYSPSREGERQEPERFTLDKDELYAKVMSSGTTCGKRDPKRGRLSRPSRVGVPVLFHNSVIACLEAEIGVGKFTKADRVKLERIATLISPALQTYREMSAVNKFTDDAALQQIGVKKYRKVRDVKAITRSVHNIISPISTGISIEIGFEEYSSVYSKEPQIRRLTRAQLRAPLDEGPVEDLRVEHRWLKRALKIKDEEVGEQVFGKFVFSTYKESVRSRHPTIATNESSFRAISDLVTDTLLDFTRGRLNQLTDLLGTALSSLAVRTPADWLGEVAKTAREAGLCWAVVRYADGDDGLLGDDEEAAALVKRLEHPHEQGRWQREKDDFWLYTLKAPEAGVMHVIRKSLMVSLKDPKDPPVTLWLGVKRCGFGDELGYVSPWKYFLDHFCEIAGSALHRLLTVERQKRRMGQVQTIIARNLTVGPLTHDLTKAAGALVKRADDLERPLTESQRTKVLDKLREKRDEIDNILLPKLAEIYERDPRQQCPLEDAVRRALERVDDLLQLYNIQVTQDLPKDVILDIPFDGASGVISTMLENSVEAIVQRARDEADEGKEIESGWINIKAQVEGDAVICDIKDNGAGVPHEIHDKLFVEVSKSRKKNSHGVGLLFFYDLLRLYDGSIDVKEYGPRPNTTFSIRFQKANSISVPLA
ncbi:MAG: ATP-binding protein [Pyrinomonadaceae bacterium]